MDDLLGTGHQSLEGVVAGRQRGLLGAGLLAACLALSACGGGGGATDETGQTPEQPQGGNGTTAPALRMGSESFLLAPSSSTTLDSLGKLAGNSAVVAAWNAYNDTTGRVMQPGLKVLFFGNAAGCESGVMGPTESAPTARMSQLQSLTGFGVAGAANGLSWRPSAAASGCDASVQDKRGASAVYVNAADEGGGVAMLSSSGVQADGQGTFLGPYTAAGQNGQGANRYIGGTFVNIRHAAWASDPLQPWLESGKARLQSVQTVARANVEGSSADVVQVKQQMMATFYNNQCRVDNSAMPCQVQYLLNTAVMRSGVTDWSTQDWFRKAQVWFDPVQGGIPIVSGPIPASGTTTTEEGNGLAIWTSQGDASQHGTFADRRFDVSIGFDQLSNVMRITTARQLGVSLASVTDAQVASVWGSRWNDPAGWSLLTAHVGQEIYNPDSRFRAEIGGGFKSLFVGPQ